MTEVKLPSTSWVRKQAELYEESGGTQGTDMNGAPCLLLDFKGRSTGMWRRTVLIYDRDGDDYLVVASYGGAVDDPQWYKNLLVNPHVQLRVGQERFDAVASTLPTAEKQRVWPHLVEIFPPYEDYQKKTSRDIPVVRLRRE